jgi:exodeoxyribonuclease VII large subunit
MEKPLFSVSDFIASINQTLEYAYSGSVAVEGEVASFKVNQDKFVFFDLKDDTGTIGCFMMLWHLRFPVEDGMKVIVTGVPKLTQWGKFSITVQAVKPSGEGSIKKSFALLKSKLDKEGLFNAERKRALPVVPSRIGVISSTQAAGYTDFIKIVNDRWGGLSVQTAHTQVQGSDAPDQIIKALQYFNQQESPVEVIVVIRGGGSADDLSAFNDERLVREIASSRIPTLVGVGHEVDETLAELAADVRAATPSNAAQIIVPDRREIIAQTRAMVSGALPSILHTIERYTDNTKHLLVQALDRVEKNVNWHADKLEYLKDIIKQLNPELVLQRGYAILRGSAVAGGLIEVETKQDIIKAEVKDVRQK